MARYLGLDTSNYTTSAAIYDAEADILCQEKKLLPVKEGTLGLRQSDAVFHHTRQLPEIVEALLHDGGASDVAAVGASERPGSEPGSYMPCFLVGSGAARQIGAILRTPVHFFTHQQGHVAAAAYGAGRTDLLASPLIAFHVSGGTTDVLLVKPHEQTVIDCTRVAGSLDLKAGQLIDRVGGRLGLPFPAGIELERCAAEATDADVKAAARPRAVLRDGSCHLSGAEAQLMR
ncbi:MAG: peptidase M22, partial [Clostridia bacterium]|nr:peptidase M22 [Clostridia bacterium]